MKVIQLNIENHINDKKLTINIIQANSGDSFLISYTGNDSKNHYLLIDGGIENTFKYGIKQLIDTIDEIDYTFITHVDNDHIGGILKLLDNESYSRKLKCIYFNTGHLIKSEESNLISENDGINLINKINSIGKITSNKQEITTKTVLDNFGLSISFLSPNLEEIQNFNKHYTLPKIDESLLISEESVIHSVETIEELSKNKFKEKSNDADFANSVSLALLISYDNKSLLFLGDAKDNVLIENIKKLGYSNKNRLNLDILKISHHGSKFHTSNEFLDLIDCNKFIVSTNGRYGHPKKEVLARILCHQNRVPNTTIHFYFNYEEESYDDTLSEEEQYKHNCICTYNTNLLEI
jgi:beta-lactamase superfamily II metal-dependent hydrolase